MPLEAGQEGKRGAAAARPLARLLVPIAFAAGCVASSTTKPSGPSPLTSPFPASAGSSASTGALWSQVAPPSSSSVTRAEPGGDAPDPVAAAFARLAREPFARRTDPQKAVALPLADAPLWRRVRFWLVPTLAGFRYGDQHHGVAAFVVRDAPTGDLTGDACLHEFEAWARPVADGMNVTYSDPEPLRVRWGAGRITVRKRDAALPLGFASARYATAYAAYPIWGNSCGVLAYAFPLGESPDLARAVRDRFAAEAFGRFEVRSTSRPGQ